MGKYHPALEWGLWHPGGWLLNEAMSLTPKKLVIGSIVLTAIPFTFLIIFGIAGQQNAMTVSGILTMLSFSITVPALLVSGIWYLMSA